MRKHGCMFANPVYVKKKLVDKLCQKNWQRILANYSMSYSNPRVLYNNVISRAFPITKILLCNCYYITNQGTNHGFCNNSSNHVDSYFEVCQYLQLGVPNPHIDLIWAFSSETIISYYIIQNWETNQIVFVCLRCEFCLLFRIMFFVKIFLLI